MMNGKLKNEPWTPLRMTAVLMNLFIFCHAAERPETSGEANLKPET